MSSKTKIVVLKMKELIYTAIFLGLAIVLITLFLVMFRPKRIHLLQLSLLPTYLEFILLPLP